MIALDRLEKQISSVAAMVEAREVHDFSADPAGRASLSSLRQHLDELRAELRLAKELREKEVIEFRLNGESAQDGTIPLHILAEVASDVSATLHSASRYLTKGTHGGPVPREIIDTLDLRLSGLAAGSTRLFITGRTAPDLFGRSALEESLKDTFLLLRSENVEDLTSAVSRLGPSGTRAIGKMLTNLASENLAVAVRWRSPRDEEWLWEAEPERLRALAATLDGFEPVDYPDLEVIGEIVTLSSKDKFLIKADDGAEYAAIVPSEKLELIKAFRVGQRAAAQLGRSAMRNRITGGEKTNYSLINLNLRPA